jgi:hypothetical protein
VIPFAHRFWSFGKNNSKVSKMNEKIGLSSIVTCFEPGTIGTKVINKDKFIFYLEVAIQSHELNEPEANGQYDCIRLRDEVNEFVSCGVGLRSTDTDDHVLRSYRGRVNSYLKRSKAVQTDKTEVTVYTRQAYLDDPQVNGDELKRIEDSDYTHVLVSVRAGTNDGSPLTPGRLVANLAGGNNNVKTLTLEDIFAQAKDAIAFDDKYSVVADVLNKSMIENLMEYHGFYIDPVFGEFDEFKSFGMGNVNAPKLLTKVDECFEIDYSDGKEFTTYLLAQKEKAAQKLTIKIWSSPEDADQDESFEEPWVYDAHSFVVWVDTVILQGYKSDKPQPSVLEALEIAKDKGYDIVTSINNNDIIVI